jgi:predicted PurR-regulated permease PerM
MDNTETPVSPSPKWSPLTKLAVAMTFVAILAAMLVRFRGLVGPFLIAIVLSYLLYPVAAAFRTFSKLSWRASVHLIYLVVAIIFGGLLAVAGITIVQQVQSLINFVGQLTANLPAIVADLSTQVYVIGPFQFSLQQYDLQALTNQVISVVQPILGRLGALVGTLATGAISTLGWAIFVLVISYFLLADAGRVSGHLSFMEIPGYTGDLQRLGIELKKIWNAYLRGQLTVVLLVMVTYTILLTGLGVRYALGIAILAGLARFVPYIGTFIAWATLAAVAFFQSGNYFGLEQYQFAILVVVIAIVVDQVFDQLISPRIIGDTLGVHPAAILVAAIIAANLIGLVGLVLAAPVVATLSLGGRYIVRKMLDLDPWPERLGDASSVRFSWRRFFRQVEALLRVAGRRIRALFQGRAG